MNMKPKFSLTGKINYTYKIQSHVKSNINGSRQEVAINLVIRDGMPEVRGGADMIIEFAIKLRWGSVKKQKYI